MKKIFRYVLLLIAIYLVVELYVFLLTKTYNRESDNYEYENGTEVNVSLINNV